MLMDTKLYTLEQLFDYFADVLPWIKQYNHTIDSFHNILMNNHRENFYLLPEENGFNYRIYPIHSGDGFLGYHIVSSKVKTVDLEEDED